MSLSSERKGSSLEKKRACYYDLSTKIIPFLDRHMGLPLLENLHEKKVSTRVSWVRRCGSRCCVRCRVADLIVEGRNKRDVDAEDNFNNTHNYLLFVLNSVYRCWIIYSHSYSESTT